jgi:hypothetical protein
MPADLDSWMRVGLFVALLLGYRAWRRRCARVAAREWLEEHRYVVHALRTPLLGAWRHFPLRQPGRRHARYAVDVRAEVEDPVVGGIGLVWLRLWPDLLGAVADDPTVAWVRTPASGGMPASRWVPVVSPEQRALLLRIAHGEHAFTAAVRGAPDPAFDALVEQLYMLAARGLVRMRAPMAAFGIPGQSYEAVDGVALMPAGERLVGGASARREKDGA